MINSIWYLYTRFKDSTTVYIISVYNELQIMKTNM